MTCREYSRDKMRRVFKSGFLKLAACVALLSFAFPLLRARHVLSSETSAQSAKASTRAAFVAAQSDTKLWRTVSPGVRFRTFSVRDEFSSVNITALRFAPNRFHVATGAMLDANGWRVRERGIAAANGGFFDASDRPMGLRASRNKRLFKLRRADWGVFAVTNRGARVVHTRDYESLRKRERVLEAVQCGPRLVVNGRVTQLKPQSARRTGIGIARDGSVVLAIADDAMSFSGWATLWNARDGLNCRDALNLDGGGSTQMALRSNRANFFIAGNRAVPDAIIVR